MMKAVLFTTYLGLAYTLVAKPLSIADYVQQPDQSFQITNQQVLQQTDSYHLWRIQFDSLRWREGHEVEPQLWQHNLLVVVPKVIKSNMSFLSIGSGQREDEINQPSPILLKAAIATGTITAQLTLVPNQPLEFFQDGVKRIEDDLVAYSWSLFLDTSDATWIGHYPMTKSAVRAMDVLERFSSNMGIKHHDGFVVSGASKRGWTTWLTALADQRVSAIIPLVIDLVNVVPSMKHHRQSLGFWSEAVGDYVKHGITDRLDSSEILGLARLIDPFYHTDKLRLPKYIINAANDQFFLPDSSLFYFDQLQGAKYLRYIPNSGHSIQAPDLADNIITFYQAVINNRELPTIDWQKINNQEIHLNSSKDPLEVAVYEATNPESRDFRMMNVDFPRYQKRIIPLTRNNQYTILVETPSSGYKSWFVEVSFPMGNGIKPFKLTTSAVVFGGSEEGKTPLSLP